MPAGAPIEVVWFKRDLRVHDHAPLVAAAATGRPVLPLYVAEPSVWGGADASGRQWAHVAGALAGLRESLAELGAPLVTRTGEVTALLEKLHAVRPIAGLWSHEETGNAATYARDRAVAAWCRARGVAWTESPSGGVVRRLKVRDGWGRRWTERMKSPVLAPPTGLRPVAGVRPGEIPEARELGLAPDPLAVAPAAAGERAAWETLADFLAGRGANYRRAMSSPLTGETACSRLSAHLACGAISTRAVLRATQARAEELAARRAAGERGEFPVAALRSFASRLQWRDHFMQKLESEPRVEHENFLRACDGLREGEWSEERFAAWREGRTGYPFVDACLRYVAATGWLNFRMRAMLVSFASHDLWLHWRRTGEQLARWFVDYEPGIHWCQMQMQSGTTGINALRIYNPVKQGEDQDPEGEFTRRWVPELARVPAAFVHAPWRMPPAEAGACGFEPGRDYPRPVVDHEEAARAAKARFTQLKRNAAARDEAREVWRRHGSRRGAHGGPRPPGWAQAESRAGGGKADQLELGLGTGAARGD